LNALNLSFEVVTPIFILIGLGFALSKLGLLRQESSSAMLKIIFTVLFPVMVFNNLQRATVMQTLNLPVMLFVIGYVLAIFAISMIIIPRIEKDNRKRSSMIQGIFRNNSLMLGIPIITALAGPENVGLMTMVVAVVVPLYNALGVVIMEVFGGQRIKLSAVLLSIIKNPLVIGSALGIAVMVTGFKLPYIIEKPIADIAKTAIPLALIVLGSFIKFGAIKDSRKDIIVVTLSRLIIAPAFFIGAAILLGFRGAELAAIMGVICAPTAVSAFVMAQQMGGDADLSANIVVFGTLFSAATIFAWIFVLKYFALI